MTRMGAYGAPSTPSGKGLASVTKRRWSQNEKGKNQKRKYGCRKKREKRKEEERERERQRETYGQMDRLTYRQRNTL